MCRQGNGAQGTIVGILQASTLRVKTKHIEKSGIRKSQVIPIGYEVVHGCQIMLPIEVITHIHAEYTNVIAGILNRS